MSAWHSWEWLKEHPDAWSLPHQFCMRGDNCWLIRGHVSPHVASREWPPSECCGSITDQHSDNCPTPERVADGVDMPLSGPVTVEWRESPPPTFLPFGINDSRVKAGTQNG